MKSAVGWLGGALAFALALGACGDPREIVLSIDTTAGVPCDVDKIRVRAVGAETATYERDVDDARFPLVLHLADETTRGSFNLEVSALKDDVEVLRATGTLQFGNAGDLSAHVVLESTCTAEDPCELPMLAGPGSTPQPVNKAVCGANVRRYAQVSPAAESYRNACEVTGPNVGAVLTAARGAALIPLPEATLTAFNFRFFGKPIRQIWVHEDGYISFSQNNPDAGNNLDPGSLDRGITGNGVPPPPQSVMVFWDNLTLRSTGVCYALEGTPGTQKLRITWTGACLVDPCTPSENLNFTIVLDERTSRISATYGTMMASNMSRAQGGSATVGIVNDAKGCAASQCNIGTGLCTESGGNGAPCGYSQAFSGVVQASGVAGVHFDPIVDPN